MHVSEESDEGVVPMTTPNDVAQAAEEEVEGRPETLGNSDGSQAPGTLSPDPSPCGLSRVREAARKDKNLRFTNLMHHITPELLLEAYGSLKRQASPGIDGVTWDQRRYRTGVRRDKPARRRE